MVQALGTLTTTLDATNAKVDSHTQHGVPQVATAAIHPGFRCLSAMQNTPTAISSAESDQASLGDQVWLWVERCRRASYTLFLVPTNDETGEEERQSQPRRRPRITSGMPRTANNTAVQQVIWPTYQNLSFMAFVNGYLSIIAQQSDTIKNHMATHLHEVTEDGEIFGSKASGTSLPCSRAPVSGTM